MRICYDCQSKVWSHQVYCQKCGSKLYTGKGPDRLALHHDQGKLTGWLEKQLTNLTTMFF